MSRPPAASPSVRSPDAAVLEVSDGPAGAALAASAAARVSTKMANHWVELGEWQGGRQLWAFYLTFAHHQELHAYAQQQQALLTDLPGLDLVQPPWLHLTVQGVAFADALGADAFPSLVEAGAAVAAAAPPLELVVEKAVAEDDSVTMPVRVSGGMTALREDLRAAASAALDGLQLYTLPEPVGGFSPHITVAYARSDSPTVEEVHERLEGFTRPPLWLEVPTLSLVRLSRGTSRWWWTEEYPLTLRSASDPGRSAGGTRERQPSA